MRQLIAMVLVLCGTATADVAAADCSQQPDQTSLNLCAAARLQASDRALNAAYAALANRVSGDGRPFLKDAESKWIAFRDAQCEFETLGSRGGSIHPSVRDLCAVDLTEAQTRRLNGQLRCQEGDVSCGGQ